MKQPPPLIAHQHIRRAASLLWQDKLVAIPTETVYGLAGNALSDQAVANIYAVKSRPSFNPLIVHLRGLEDAVHYGIFSDTACTLARHFWPGPLTLILPRRMQCRLSLLVSAGLDTVALRVPAHPLAQALLHESRLPLAAPSANRSGKISPTLAQHVRDELQQDVSHILDGGACTQGLESTIIDMTADQPTLLRPGTITIPQIEAVINHKVQHINHTAGIRAPGMLTSHYAPELPLRLNATHIEPHEALLAFAAHTIPADISYNLSEQGDLTQAAANLFRMLRDIDNHARHAGKKAIAVMPIPMDDDSNALGHAINDRLQRAAAPREPTKDTI